MIKRRPRRVKIIRIEEIKQEINKRLADPTLGQMEKRELTRFIEDLLMATHNYNGFNNVYWLDFGHKRWVEDGTKFPPSDDYIYGPDGKDGGEYTRRYY